MGLLRRFTGYIFTDLELLTLLSGCNSTCFDRKYSSRMIYDIGDDHRSMCIIQPSEPILAWVALIREMRCRPGSAERDPSQKIVFEEGRLFRENRVR